MSQGNQEQTLSQETGDKFRAALQLRRSGRKRLSGAKYLVKEGDLVVTNLNYNDTGQYTCAAKNILGSSEASGSLTVRSKKNIFFFLR